MKAKKRLNIGCLCGWAAVSLSLTAHAVEYPDTRAFADAMEVPDDVLGDMRGRYVAGNGVLFFGVEMYTEWKSPTGEVIAANAQFSIDLTSGSPVVRFVPTVSIAEGASLPAATSGQTITISGGGLANPTGVVQAAQVAGDGNRVANGMAMNVEIGPSGSVNVDGGAVTPSTTSMTAASGATGTVALDGNSLKVMVTTPDNGGSFQTLGAGAMTQQAMVMGNSHRVSNFLDMNIRMAKSLGADPVMINTHLQSLRGISVPGGF